MEIRKAQDDYLKAFERYKKRNLPKNELNEILTTYTIITDAYKSNGAG